MSDGYKGESLQKKAARYTSHSLNREWQRPDIWKGGLHIFLCSREGGDIGVLSSLGVPFGNMVAMDRDDSALESAWEKWGFEEASEAPNFVVADAGHEVHWINTCLKRARGYDHRGYGPLPLCTQGRDCWVESWAAASAMPWIASVFLDFCGHIDRGTVDAISRAWSVMDVGSVLTVAVLKGREKAQKVESVTNHPLNRFQRRRQRATGSAASFLLARMMRGEVSWDARAVLDSIEAEGVGPVTPVGSRWLLLFYALCHACRQSEPAPVSLIEYQSRVGKSQGVPMMIASFGKAPIGRSGASAVEVKMTEERARQWQSGVVARHTAAEAAFLLNVSKPSAAALKARVTRSARMPA